MKINRSGIQQSPYGRCETKHTYNTNRYKNACRYTTGKYDIYEKVNLFSGPIVCHMGFTVNVK